MVVQVKQNILPPEVCQHLINIFEISDKLTRYHDNIVYINEKDALFNPLIEKTLQELECRESLHPETMLLSKFHTGGLMKLHADNCKQDENGNWIPNDTPNRVLSVVYFLNEDFEGGDLYFPQYDLNIKPKTGMMVYYSSDQHHIHAVKQVTSGNRYKLAIWFGMK